MQFLFLQNGQFCTEMFLKIDHNITINDIVNKIFSRLDQNAFQKILRKWKKIAHKNVIKFRNKKKNWEKEVPKLS